MFEGLSERLGAVFQHLSKRGALSEGDIDGALREVRQALLEADVAIGVVKDFLAKVRTRALGQEVIKSVTPAQMVIKIVHDTLMETLGGQPDAAAALQPAPTAQDDNLGLAVGTPPSAILMLGLQGSGKTTTSGKIAKRLMERSKKRVLLASLDIYRPAAWQQLNTLGTQIGAPVLDFVMGEKPLAIAKRAMHKARTGAFDVVILDSAGRRHIEEALMAEIRQIHHDIQPAERLLVADALTGQDAVHIAKAFHEAVPLTGIALSRMDGDGRGGAALSMRAVTGCPVKLMGTGETLDGLDTFDAKRVADSILGMGDVVGLVEKARELMDEEDAARLAKRAMKGLFTLDDFATQLAQLSKMGDINSLMGMLPGIGPTGKMKKQMANAAIDNKALARQRAIIGSMTITERKNPKILNASRRRRIASGSGTGVQEVNLLLKQHRQMQDFMKKAGKNGLLKKGGLPPQMGPAGMNMPLGNMPGVKIPRTGFF